MIISDISAARRRIPVYLTDVDGAPVPGLTGWTGAEITIAKNGAADVNFAGTMSENNGSGLGAGHYTYECTVGEIDTQGKIVLKVNKAGAQPYAWAEDIDPNLASAIAGIALAPITVDTGVIAEAVADLVMDDTAPVGMRTLRENVNVIASYIAGEADGYPPSAAQQLSYKKLGDSEETRLVGTVSGGRRTISKADGR